MHYHILDSYQPRESLLHRLDARVKLVIVLAFILTTALTPVGVWPVFILLLALVTTALIISELGVRFVYKRSLLALPFVLAALPVIFAIEGDAWFSISLWFGTLTVYGQGVERFASIALKSWISMQAAVLLASTTHFPELLVAMRSIGIPRLLVAVFALMWRYLFVLADEALRLMRARTSRSGLSEIRDVKPGGNLAWRARVTGGMVGGLLLRALERSDRIYNAMLSRGYNGEVRAAPHPRLNFTDLLILASCLVLLAVLLALSLLFRT